VLASEHDTVPFNYYCPVLLTTGQKKWIFLILYPARFFLSCQALFRTTTDRRQKFTLTQRPGICKEAQPVASISSVLRCLFILLWEVPLTDREQEAASVGIPAQCKEVQTVVPICRVLPDNHGKSN
jgi:hypothetical protein